MNLRRTLATVLTAVIVCISLGVVAPPASAAPGDQSRRRAVESGRAALPPVVVRAGPARKPTFVPPPRRGPRSQRAEEGSVEGPPRSNLVGPPASTINVTYDADFTPDAQAAFQYAVDIWGSLIVTSVPIEIDAKWDTLETNTLGSAGATLHFWSSAAPQPNTFYPVALWNAIRGVDACPVSSPCGTTTADIGATFNSARTDWYFGTDGNAPPNTFDFVSVVLHEIGHGLGMQGWMDVAANGQGSYGGSNKFPGIYDRFTETAAGVALIDTSAFPNPSMALGDALKSGALFADATNAVYANGGQRPKLYAPSTWNDGSSYGHWDESTYPAGHSNSLMTPQLSPGEAVHTPGPITLGWFRDLGWSTTEAPNLDEPGARTYTKTDDLAIGYNAASPSVSTINVPDAGTIADVDVRVRINHTWAEDVEIGLQSPQGTIINLSDDNGGDGDNYGTGVECSGTPTEFDDEATAPIIGASPPFAGAYDPETPLTAFDGHEAAGAWTLRLLDNFELEDTGTLLCWQLVIRTATTPPGEPPLAVDDYLKAVTDGSGTMNVLANDEDADGDPLTLVDSTDGTSGTVDCLADGECTYTPIVGFVGYDEFTYTASDGAHTSIGTVYVTVDTNAAPVATDDVLDVFRAGSATVDVLENDTDADLDDLFLTASTNGAQGSVVCADRSCTYATTSSSFTGTDSFTYTISDGVATDTATVAVTIGDCPVIASAIGSATGSIVTGESWQACASFRANAISSLVPTHLTAPGGTLALLTTGKASDAAGPNDETATSTAHGTTRSGAYDASVKRLDITVPTGANCVSFDVVFASDEYPESTASSFNDAFVAELDATTWTVDGAGNLFAPDNFAYDANGNALSVTSGFFNDVVTDNGTEYDGASPVVTARTPALPGAHTLYLSIFDAGDDTIDSAAFIDNLQAINAAEGTCGTGALNPNRAPVAQDSTASGDEDNLIHGAAIATDADNDVLAYEVVTGPAHGSVAMATDGAFTYTPVENYNGPDSFTFRVNDGHAFSGTATVAITVAPVNDAPVALGGSPSTDEDVPVLLVLNATDVDGDSVTFDITAPPTQGSLSSASDGEATYSPNANFNGTDSFSFTARDGELTSAPATVSLTVVPVNDAPTATPQSVTVQKNGQVAISLMGSDVDVDPIVAFVVESAPSHGSLSGSAPALMYSPTSDYVGSDSLTFTVSDGTLTSLPSTVAIEVGALATTLSASSPNPTFGTMVPSNAIDGNASTYWQPTEGLDPRGEDPKTLTVSLPAQVSVGSVRLHWYSTSFRGIDYTLSVSTDAAAWQTVASVSGNASADRTHSFSSLSTRFIRLHVTRWTSQDNSHNYGPALRELTWADAVATASSPNPTFGAMVPSNAIDGNASTYWQPTEGLDPRGEDPKTLTVSLPAQVSVGSVRTEWYSTDFRGIDYSISVSTDAVAWQTVASVSGNAPADRTHSFSSSSARYIRLHVTRWTSVDNSRNYGPALRELTWGMVTASSPNPTFGAMVPSNAIDGDASTYWQPTEGPDPRGEDPKTLTVSLPAQVSVGSVRAHWYSTSFRGIDYSVRVSTDAVAWQTVASVSGNASADRTHSFSSLSARFIRLHVTRWTSMENSHNYGPALRELTWGEAVASASSPNPTFGTMVPSNAIDGNASTYWQTTEGPGLRGEDPKTLTVSLPVSVSVGSARTEWYSTGFRGIDYSISVSNDGLAWQTVAVITGNTLVNRTHSFSSSSASFIRLHVTRWASPNNSYNYGPALREITWA